MDEPLRVWFTQEILAHEAALVRYLSRAWPKRDEVHDLRQEVYTRVFRAARQSRPTSPRAFLFATARHLLADRLRRARIVSIDAVSDIEELNVKVDEVSPERRVAARQELKRLAQAFDALPPRCREVIWLRRVDGLSQKEVASRLGISVRTVESYVFTGMRQLADGFLAKDLTQGDGAANVQTDMGSTHGQHTD